MKVKVNRIDLLENAKKVAKVIRGNMEEQIYFAVTKEKVYLSGISRDASIKTSCSNFRADESFECLIPANVFLNTLNALKTEEYVVLEYLEKRNTMIISGGRLKLTMQCLNKRKWIGVPDKNESDFNVSTETLFDLIIQTAHALPMKDSTSVMSSFYIQYGKGAWKVTALDGHRISVRGKVDEVERDFLVLGSNMLTLALILKDKITLSIQDANTLLLSDDNTEIFVKTVAGAYYSINDILKQKTPYSCEVSRNDLEMSLQFLRSVFDKSDQERSIMIFDGESQSLKIQTKKQGNIVNMDDLLSANINTNAKTRLGVNAIFLFDAICSLPESETITFLYKDKKSPIMIKSDDYLELILPILIKN